MPPLPPPPVDDAVAHFCVDSLSGVVGTGCDDMDKEFDGVIVLDVLCEGGIGLISFWYYENKGPVCIYRHSIVTDCLDC